MEPFNRKLGYASTEIEHLESCERSFKLIYLMSIGLFSTALFLYGFFPLKDYDNRISSSKDIPTHIEGVRIQDDILYKPLVEKIIFIVIDGLRWDFVAGPMGQEYMPTTRNLIHKDLACLLQAKVDSPTVTMPRIKAITTGTVPSFIDVALNFGTKRVTGDSWLLQAKNHGHKLVFYGDDTWIRLFPSMFDRHDGTTSFFVSDYTEVDNNVTRHIERELSQNDWSIMILHYLGLDHIGHIDGSRSKLIKPKLNEMDEIIDNIYFQVKNWDAKTLIIVCGDHGMKDAGGHGGNTPQETLVPFITIGTSCHAKTDENNKIAQIDISSTLATLLGLPIPSSNLGSISPHLLGDLSSSKILFSLYYNAKQVYGHFRKLGGYQSYRAYEKYENAIKLHSAWLGSMGDMNETVDEIIDLYVDTLKDMREALTNSMIRYDLRVMAIAIFFIYHTLYVLAIAKQTVTPSVKKILKFLILNTILWILLNRLWDASSETLLYSSDVNNTTFYMTIAVIFFVNTYLCTKVVCTVKSIQERVRDEGIIQILLTLGTVLHAVSLFSSSFVEEEHRTWWFLWSTLCILLLYEGIKKYLSSFLRNKNIYGYGFNRKFYCAQCLFKLWLCLLAHNILRNLNSTGDAYAHLPDIADWLQQQENKVYMSAVLIIALSVLVYIGYTAEEPKYKTSSTIIYFSITICIYFRHMANDAVLRIPMTPASKGIYEVNAFWCFMVIATILNASRIRNTIRNDRSNLFRQCLYFITQIWVMLSALLHRPYNVGLLPIQLFTSITVHKVLQHCQKEHMTDHVHYFLGNVFYFYQGNSNNLSTIDVAAGYVGMQSYNFYLTGVFLIVNTYSAPVLAYFMLLYNVTSGTDHPKYPGNILQINRNYATWRLLPMALYTIVASIQRYHLFVWTVFSPKLMYEAMYCTVMYVVMLIINVMYGFHFI